jgi:hypothetical protein
MKDCGPHCHVIPKGEAAVIQPYQQAVRHNTHVRTRGEDNVQVDSALIQDEEIENSVPDDDS